jgi:hypothetical protein
MKQIIDYKSIDMSELEFESYQQIVESFTDGNISGNIYFHDTFEVDDDGCIMFIKTPLQKQIPWAVIIFLQNLMINQRIRRVEENIKNFCKNTMVGNNDR